MLDVALLMANASQLKAVLEQGPSASFYTPIVALISISLLLQVAVGILLIFSGERINAQRSLSKLDEEEVSPPTVPLFFFFFLLRSPDSSARVNNDESADSKQTEQPNLLDSR